MNTWWVHKQLPSLWLYDPCRQLAVVTRGIKAVARRGIAHWWSLLLLKAVDRWHVVLHLVAMDVSWMFHSERVILLA